MKRGFKVFCMCSVMALVISGCFKNTYTVGAGGDTEAKAAHDNQWHAHWLFGTIGETEINLEEVCPSGDATIKDQVSWLNALIGTFTGIVWYPSTVRIYCEGGGGESADEEVEEEMTDEDAF
ncbi:unnamed protein product, partial [marine sediment metagenome]